jgi:hypothetical protein
VLERSSWSRNESVLEVGDVSRDEAFQYLKLRDIDSEQAAQVYELVGGRIILLKHVANKILNGTELNGMYPFIVWVTGFSTHFSRFTSGAAQ